MCRMCANGSVEPRLGLGDVGAKWEELLLIQDGEARWLDDNVPHVRWGGNTGQFRAPAIERPGMIEPAPGGLRTSPPAAHKADTMGFRH